MSDLPTNPNSTVALGSSVATKGDLIGDHTYDTRTYADSAVRALEDFGLVVTLDSRPAVNPFDSAPSRVWTVTAWLAL